MTQQQLASVSPQVRKSPHAAALAQATAALEDDDELDTIEV